VRLLVVGICTRPEAASARRAPACREGRWDVVGLDYFGDRDQRLGGETYALGADFDLPCTPQNLVRAAATLRYDAVAYSASLENHPALVEALAANDGGGCLLLGNSAATLARVRHVPSLMRACRRAGIRFPTTLLRTLPVARAGANGATPVRWLRKPHAAGGGRGVREWLPADARPAAQDGYLQQYVPGRAFSATFVANGRDAVVVGLAEGLAGLPRFGATGFGYCGSLVPPRGVRAAWLALLPRLEAAARDLTRAFGLVGLNGMDLIAGPAEDDMTLLEVNPRYSASMEVIERAYGVPLFSWHAEAITGGTLPRFDLAAALRGGTERWGKAIVYAHETVTIPDTDPWLAAGVADVPRAGETIARGAPICTVFSCAPLDAGDEACLAGLAERAAWIAGQLRSAGAAPDLIASPALLEVGAL
jgi:predicted ATP-grasp superfamily ATP-dependent carboligase